jgi:hypothetical protein
VLVAPADVEDFTHWIRVRLAAWAVGAGDRRTVSEVFRHDPGPDRTRRAETSGSQNSNATSLARNFRDVSWFPGSRTTMPERSASRPSGLRTMRRSPARSEAAGQESRKACASSS